MHIRETRLHGGLRPEAEEEGQTGGVLMRLLWATVLPMLAVNANAADSSVLLESLLAENTYPITLDAGVLSGKGFDLLLQAAENAQFVNVGEPHDNYDIPRFTAALFRALHDAHQFNYFATEQDPLMMQRVSADPVRGNRERIEALAKEYPYGFMFASDQELEMLATIGTSSTAKTSPIWGAEQASGATHYLDALNPLAPSKKAKVKLLQLRAQVWEQERKRGAKRRFLGGQGHREALLQLKTMLLPRPGSRADFLLHALLVSDEVYGYYRRAASGKVVGLYNNTVREAYMKRRFMEKYRIAEAVDGSLPRVLLKYGHAHLYRGRNPFNAYTIGNFTHEFSISNGMEAIGITVVAYGPGYVDLVAKAPDSLKPLTKNAPKQGWNLIDLRPLRPFVHARRITDMVPEKDLEAYRRLIFGFEFFLLMSESKGAEHKVTEGGH